MKSSSSIIRQFLCKSDHQIFSHRPLIALALFRFLIGSYLVLWGISLFPQYHLWFSPDAFLSQETVQLWNNSSPKPWSAPWPIVGPGTVYWWVILTLVIFSFTFTFGLLTRVSSWIVFLTLQAILYRGFYVMYGGDYLVHMLVLYLAFSPCGEAFSFDRWRKEKISKPGSHCQVLWIPWAQRLIQFQFSLVYIATSLWKYANPAWRTGEAFYNSVHMENYCRHVAWFDVRSRIFFQVGGWGIILSELASGTLIWVPQLRKYILLLFLALCLSIDFFICIPFWQWLMAICSVVFINDFRLLRWAVLFKRFIAALWRKKPLRGTVKKWVAI